MKISHRVTFDLLVSMGLLLGLACWGQEAETKVFTGFGDARWIGSTQDGRPAEWATRAVTFNRPPADIATWKPTEKELRATNKKSHPAPLLRKRFDVTKPFQSARISICGLGLYELHLNGTKVGDRVLDPAQTTYDKRAFVVVHDVTHLLHGGTNAVGVMLGNGFYGQNISFGGGLAYGPPRARLVIEIGYNDGSISRVESDATWKASNGPVLFDNIYLGETFDARRWQKGWSEPDFNDADWQPVNMMEAPTATLVEQQLEPMRKIRKVEPIAVLPAEKGWILDMGQNMTGWLQISLAEPPGTAVTMRFAEHLMPDKRNIDTASTGIHVTGADQTDIYICRGGGVETWEPRFTYHGFRYVQIEGLGKKPELKDFTGWLVRTDAKSVGTFECSDPLINKFYRVSMWTLEDNLQGILTDCPHRERCAWMGDNHAVAEAASFNFDLQQFWRKTSADMETVLGAAAPNDGSGLPRDARAPCNVAVGKRLCGQARPDWGAATVLVPWYGYLYYGDQQIVKSAWPMMVGWLAYLDESVAKAGIITEGYGDWCPPDNTGQKRASVALTSTALYYKSLWAMQRMALVVGEPQAAAGYAAKAEVVKKAFNEKFFDAAKNDYGTQTGNAYAIECGLVPAGKEQAVADNLARIIMADCGGHDVTGIFGHRALYTVLNDYGHAEVTRHLLSSTDYPSLGFLTEKHDLTTWPEGPHNWNPAERYRRNSFNHPMHSGFAAAFHESLGGIRPDPAGPGFKNFFLKPCFLPGLEWANVGHRSPYGLISSDWKRESGTVIWNVSVPAGSTARVQLPQLAAGKIRLAGQPVSSNEFELRPGTWSIRIAE